VIKRRWRGVDARAVKVTAACLLMAGCAAGPGSGVRASLGSTEGWPQVPVDAFPAAVARVVDGDTFVARRSGRDVRVRLIGIDAPESVKPDAPVQCFGPESARALTELLRPGTRLMAHYQGTPERDQYGRDLWDVWVAGRFLQAELVSRGLARARAYRPQTEYADVLEQLGQQAETAHLGLFGACPRGDAA
jgi:micrococcal nuclease